MKDGQIIRMKTKEKIEEGPENVKIKKNVIEPDEILRRRN